MTEPESSKHNLPQQLTSFVGREKEIAVITDLISQHRLVMLTGVGGIGKTNLSLQVGRKMLDAFPDGVWVVELAPLADGELIAQTAVSALGLPDSRTQPALQTVLNYLQEKSCLLILDNCEHLINAAAQFVQTLLQNCPDLKILASSREALGVPGEMPFHVPSLSIPDAAQDPSLDEWQQYDALRLFVERATAVMPDFQVTPDNITPLIQICHRLDGIPLALELAAARVKILTLAQIAERLKDRFRLLTGGSRTALPRQQTLRALIDWSWELLSKTEQLLLQRLSVFAGGMDLEAIEAVCADDLLDAYDILEVLSALVNKSLVIAQREQGKSTHYQLLETIRQYAWERLLTAGQNTLLRLRHLNYFLQLSEQAEQALVGPDQVTWMNRLEKERDNIRVALNWANNTDSEKGLRLTTNLYRVSYLWGNYRESEAWLAQLLAHTDKVDVAIQAKAMGMQGTYNIGLANFDRARQLLEESLSLYQSLADQNGIAFCFQYLGWAANILSERDTAQNYMTNSIVLYREMENKLGLADALHLKGDIVGGGLKKYEQAAVYLQESQSLYRELGHLAGIAGVLFTSGMLAFQQGDYDTARLYLEEGLVYNELIQGNNSDGWIFITIGGLYFRLEEYEKSQSYLEKSIFIGKQIGEKFLYSWAQVFLGYCFLWGGKLAQARTIFKENQRQFKEINLTGGVIFATEGLAILAVRWQQPERAARLFAWADATREAIQDPRPPAEQADVDRETQTILQMIDEETYAAAYAAGQAMTMDEAIALAVAES